MNTAEKAKAYQCAAVWQDQVGMIWPQVEGLINEALEHAPGHQTAEDIKAALMDGSMLLLVFLDIEIEAVAVLELLHFPRKTSLHATIVAGDNMDAWLPDLLTHMEELGREKGATEISAIGREGWGRHMKQFGFATHAYITRALEPRTLQ